MLKRLGQTNYVTSVTKHTWLNRGETHTHTHTHTREGKSYVTLAQLEILTCGEKKKDTYRKKTRKNLSLTS